MRRLTLTLAVLGGLCAAAPAAAQTPDQPLVLQLLAALPVEGLDNAQPSGLCLVDGQLYAVSDRHDHAICRVDLRQDHAVLEPYITFNAPWSGAWVRGLDFEGLAYRDGSFFIVSEANSRVLRVHETGSDLAWVIPSVEEIGVDAGLFGEKNARLEGLALLGGGRVVLAAERAPRGLLDVVIDSEGGAQITALVCANSGLDIEPPREADFSDLFFDGTDLFALTRNADAVVRIAFDGNGLEELEAWSFAHVTNAPEFRYQDMTFGKAEGLTMDDEHVYVILDNNGLARANDPT
ncbi:MAG: esterase-like activity of phytase family protein [bacterium]|nr:esterase-like activity of phytase family protein [bacterium]